MTKKKLKRASSRRSKRQAAAARHHARSARNSRRALRAVVAARPREVVDPRVAQFLKLYAEAMRHFNRQSFRRAKEILEKVVAGPSRELAERARVHLRICEQRLQRPAPVYLRTAEDHYNYSVSLINQSRYDEAGTHLEKARKLAPKADHIYYALASVAALTGEADQALEHLAKAIKLRPENRYHARHDADFESLQADPRFQRLLYAAPSSESRLAEARA